MCAINAAQCFTFALPVFFFGCWSWWFTRAQIMSSGSVEVSIMSCFKSLHLHQCTWTHRCLQCSVITKCRKRRVLRYTVAHQLLFPDTVVCLFLVKSIWNHSWPGAMIAWGVLITQVKLVHELHLFGAKRDRSKIFYSSILWARVYFKLVLFAALY